MKQNYKNQIKNSLFSLIILIVISSCVNPTPRRPINHYASSYLKKSVELNRKINILQEKAIKYYIAQDSMSNYYTSSDGFWYKYHHKIDKKGITPITGDEVFFEYEILDLTNKILYSKNELGGENKLLIDKEDAESGMQNGLKLMKEGEEILFIFPSYKAFGYSGDQQKIGVNQPLIYKVKLNKINK